MAILPRLQFDDELSIFRAGIARMATLVSAGVQNAVSCLLGDPASNCNLTIADDYDIDSLGYDIDDMGTRLLDRHHPRDHDLRQLIAGIKISKDLERIGDYGVSIVRRTSKLRAPLPDEERVLIEPVTTAVVQLINDAAASFTRGDRMLARSVYADSRRCKESATRVAEEFVTRLEEQDAAANSVQLVFIMRDLKRIAHHAKSIAGDVLYAANAEDERQRDFAFGDIRGRFAAPLR